MSDLNTLLRRVTMAEHRIEREIGEAKAVARRIKDGQAAITDLEDKADALEEVIGILNSFADKKQVEVKNKVEGLVTQGLQSIFGPDLSFHILQEVKAKRVETRFVVRSQFGDQELETSILDARGGGVAAVAGFLLRLIVLLLQPKRRHFLVCDETFGMLSAEYESALIEFVRELVDRTSVQILLVTHKAQDEWIEAADRAYAFTLKDGRTVVTEVTVQADTEIGGQHE